jgi:hypothetical protein
VIGAYGRFTTAQPRLLPPHRFDLDWRQNTEVKEPRAQLAYSPIYAVRMLIEIKPLRRANHNGETEYLLWGKGLEIAVEVVPRGLRYPTALRRERHLIKIKLKDLALTESRFEPPRLDPLDQSRPEGALARM